jgi:hypothetical protein
MIECFFCGHLAETEKRNKSHIFDGALLYGCRSCGEATNIRVRLHLSCAPGGIVDEETGEYREAKNNVIYKLGRKYWLRRGSLARCLNCFKSLGRFESENLIIKKYSQLSEVTGVIK